ncbi:MAG: tRNA (adenosine(37)-N6)-threonylcarbamoyltransferase complex dimerization subunit type 1 TsaB [Oscillospiraceae bacterium]|nr:tRNA (adenosine(37)-N6)-threonylcarbamoyltransferase complex dimerization subunit type 1 TsaB [Oscillospiraceae bacterium]
MILLAFESSAKSAGAALYRDGAFIGENLQASGQTHSRTLLEIAEDLLKTCELTVDDVDAVAVAAGPGSFTGLRIGIAAAKGFAWGREIPCVGVSTLEAMARGAAVTDGVYVCCMDARRAQVYNAIFEIKDGKLTRLCPDRAVSIEELNGDLEKIEKPKILVGDGALLCYNTLSDNGELILPPEHLRLQRPAGVALAALEALSRGETASAAELRPNYLRLSQAERDRAERLKKESEMS